MSRRTCCLRSKYDYKWKSGIGHLQASRYVELYCSIKLQTICFWQYLLSTQQLAEYIYTLIYSLSTTNCPLENETYGHKRDNFATTLAHNGIVEPRFPVLHDWCVRIVSSSSHIGVNRYFRAWRLLRCSRRSRNLRTYGILREKRIDILFIYLLKREQKEVWFILK